MYLPKHILHLYIHSYKHYIYIYNIHSVQTGIANASLYSITQANMTNDSIKRP